MIQAVNAEYALAKARLAATEQAMREATGQGGLNYDDSVRLRELERTAAVNKSLFEDVLQKAKITDEQSTFRPRDARVDHASSNRWPELSQCKKIIIDRAVYRARAGNRRRVRNGNAECRLHHATAGRGCTGSSRSGLGPTDGQEQARQQEKEGKAVPVAFYHVHYPLSPFSEAIRTLRSGIHMSDVDRPPKVIHVTSSRPGEGKTTIAISLAISAAISGLKVALVDADLRHPSAVALF